MAAEDAVHKALDFIMSYGGIDGDHHKQWAMDQVVRILTEDENGYALWVIKHNRPGGEEYDVYEWDEGIPP